VRLEPLLSVTAMLEVQEIGARPAGLRMNMHFEGDSDSGSRVRGHIKGVDYLTVRSDGVVQLDVHATLTSPDGDVVAIVARGVAVTSPGGAVLGRLALTFETASDKLAWLNRALGVAITNANMKTGELRLVASSLEE
jgi:hypothetical protein